MEKYNLEKCQKNGLDNIKDKGELFLLGSVFPSIVKYSTLILGVNEIISDDPSSGWLIFGSCAYAFSGLMEKLTDVGVSKEIALDVANAQFDDLGNKIDNM